MSTTKPIDETRLKGWVDGQAEPARDDASSGFYAGAAEQLNDRAPTVTRWELGKNALGPLGWIPPGAFMQSTFWNSKVGASYRVNLLIQLPTGVIAPFTQVVTPTSDRAVNTRQDSLPEGFILSLTVQPLTAGVHRGHCFATFNLSIGSGSDTINYRLLASGYVYNPHFTASPNMNEDPTAGPGLVRLITGTNPAAGVEISEVVPTNARWRLQALQVNLVTDVTVINRTVAFLFDDGASSFAKWGAPSNQAASLNNGYTLAPLGLATSPSSGDIQIPMAPQLFLPSGFRIRTATLNLQAADDYGAPKYVVEEWIDP